MAVVIGILLGLAAPAAASVMGTPVASSTVTATQETTGKFVFAGISATCSTETFSGGLGAPIEELEVSATYSGCTAAGVSGATISMNGCTYLLYGGAQTGENVFDGAISIKCPSEKKIIFKVTALSLTCEISIGPQKLLAGATYVNHPGASPKADVTLEVQISELKYTVIKSGLCGSGSGEQSNGQYSGKWLMKAETGGAAVEYLLWKSTTLCMERLLPCPFKPVNKRYEAPQPLRAKATDWKLVGVYENGAMPPPKITITCGTAVVGGESTEETSGWFSTRLKAKFPIMTLESCKDELNNTCEVSPQDLGYTGYFVAVAAGNGRLELEPHFVIECPGRWKCAYKDSASLTVNGGAGTALIEAVALQLKPDPAYVGLRCGGAESQKASWTVTYHVEEPANLFLSET